MVTPLGLGARDLQQRRERALHAVEFFERRRHEFLRRLPRGRSAGAQLRFLEAHAQPVQRRAQIVRDAVERGAQRRGLLLDAIEHGVDRAGERVEFVARAVERAAAA